MQEYQLPARSVLVTGAAGFVGRALVRALNMGFGDIAADRTDDFAVPAGVKRIKWNLPSKPEPDPGPVRFVVHLAALSSVADSEKAPMLFDRVNVLGTASVVHWMQEKAPDARLLMVSSAEVYAPSSSLLDEQSELAPVNNYGKSKLKAEKIVMDSGLDWVISRSFPHYGPGQKGKFVLPSFCSRIIQALRSGKTEIRVGNLSAVRDYLYIADVVRAYITLLAKGHSRCVYNVCSGAGHSIGDLLQMLLEQEGNKLQAVTEKNLLREKDQVRQVGSSERLRSLGWEPSVSLNEGLSLLYRWWEERI